MTTSEKKEFDRLDKFMNREKIEKAPDGFTGRVMSSVTWEKVPAREKYIFYREKTVPVIIVTVLATLIIIALVLPSSPQTEIEKNIAKFFQLFSAPVIDKEKISSFTVPSVLIYIAGCLPFFFLFDFSLRKYFRKRG